MATLRRGLLGEGAEVIGPDGLTASDRAWLGRWRATLETLALNENLTLHQAARILARVPDSAMAQRDPRAGKLIARRRLALEGVVRGGAIRLHNSDEQRADSWIVPSCELVHFAKGFELQGGKEFEQARRDLVQARPDLGFKVWSDNERKGEPLRPTKPAATVVAPVAASGTTPVAIPVATPPNADPLPPGWSRLDVPFVTPELEATVAVMREFWASYDQAKPATAPKSAVVLKWLEANRPELGITQRENVDAAARHVAARKGGAKPQRK